MMDEPKGLIHCGDGSKPGYFQWDASLVALWIHKSKSSVHGHLREIGGYTKTYDAVALILGFVEVFSHTRTALDALHVTFF